MLVDNFNRKIDYLRISVTDRCNLRCIYCMPEQGILHKPHSQLISFEEIAKIVKIAAGLGISKLRLTGGEPLIRKDLTALIKMLVSIKGIEDLSMTTNGILLKECAGQLKQAGLKRINISLDSLDEDKYKRITRGGNLSEVWESIHLALAAGFSDLKINVLLISGINDTEICDFLRLTLENRLHIRFLEIMPIRKNEFSNYRRFVSCPQILNLARRLGCLQPANIYGHGPAKYYRIKGGLGTFGFITPLSDKFCSKCNRLRLTSDGFLKSCLHSDLKVNLRDPLRQGLDEQGLIQLIKLAVKVKPKEHALNNSGEIVPSEYFMCEIGG